MSEFLICSNFYYYWLIWFLILIDWAVLISDNAGPRIRLSSIQFLKLSSKPTNSINASQGWKPWFYDRIVPCGSVSGFRMVVLCRLWKPQHPKSNPRANSHNIWFCLSHSVGGYFCEKIFKNFSKISKLYSMKF